MHTKIVIITYNTVPQPNKFSKTTNGNGHGARIHHARQAKEDGKKNIMKKKCCYVEERKKRDLHMMASK